MASRQDACKETGLRGLRALSGLVGDAKDEPAEETKTETVETVPTDTKVEATEVKEEHPTGPSASSSSAMDAAPTADSTTPKRLPPSLIYGQSVAREMDERCVTCERTGADAVCFVCCEPVHHGLWAEDGPFGKALINLCADFYMSLMKISNSQ